jgi:hypothetical protein
MREICTSGSVGGEGGNILAYLASVRRAGGGDDRRHELKPLAAIQRVRLPPGKGRAGQPEASLAREQQCEARSVGQQVPKLRQSAPKSANAEAFAVRIAGAASVWPPWRGHIDSTGVQERIKGTGWIA